MKGKLILNNVSGCELPVRIVNQDKSSRLIS